ncbi:hypothetical protein N7454_003323 [Penicillium verhagenii]|nr:hypothetical protein N7454_003323 [Penicillium verhagenii]
MMRLERFLMTQKVPDSLMERARDAWRFIKHHKSTIEHSPLQVYASALIFSPIKSTTRRQFATEQPDWITDLFNAYVAWGPNERVASTSYDGTTGIWDISTGQCETTRKSDGGILLSSVTWLHENKLATVSADGTAEIWDTSPAERTLIRQQLVVLTKDQRIVTPQGPCILKTKSYVFNFKDALESFVMVAWSHGGRLALATMDSTIHTWDSASDRCSPPLEGQGTKAFSMAWSSDGARLASAYEDGSIKLWNMISSSCLQTIHFAHDKAIYCIAWSKDSSRLASVSTDKTIKIWNTDTGQLARRLSQDLDVAKTKREDTHTSHGHSYSHTANVIAWSPDLTRLRPHRPTNPSNLEKSSGKCLATFTGHTHDVASIAWSSGGSKLASGSADATVKIWDTTAGRCIASLEGHTGILRSVAWLADDARLASASDDRTVRTWDADGEPLLTLRGCVGTIAWSEDGARLASASRDGSIRIWDTAKGECGGALVYPSDIYQGLQVWDVASEKSMPILEVHGEIFWARFDRLRPHTLHTDIGSFDLSTCLVARSLKSGVSIDSKPVLPVGYGYGIDETGSWITCRGEKRIRLPSEFKIACSAILPGRTGIGCDSGRVLRFGVSEAQSF